VLSNALRPAAVLVQPLLGARETVESGCALPADSTPE
jgi:hypothetical protein